ncbi:MAG: FHA domain-containing protein [Planctomycetota bacterium]|nr:FHA domain-containing protein [Planctomycetota bacterium]
MAELLISRKDGELLLTVDLADRTKLTIGRSPRCDLTIEASSISRRHALLVRHGGHWVLLDTGSSTGVFSGEVRTRCTQLREDQWARIGPVYLWLNLTGDEPAEPTREAEEGDGEARPGRRQSPWSLPEDDPLLAALSPTADSEPEEPAGAELLLYDLDGHLLRRKSLISREKLTVGRSHRCDLTIDDQAVSRLHCVLYLEGERWCVADADSAGGTRVDGRPTHRRRLDDRMLIRLGPYLLQVEGAHKGTGKIEGEPTAAAPLHVSAFLGERPGESAESGDSEPAARPGGQADPGPSPRSASREQSSSRSDH